MRRVLDLMGSALDTTWETLVAALGGGMIVPLLGLLLLLVALVVLLSLLPRWRSSRSLQYPEVLVSKGGIAHRERDGVLVMRLTVSNLNPYPLQLLELSVRMSGLPAPLTTEVAALIAPQGVVDLTAELEQVDGDEGTLELYVYAADTRRKTYRVLAKLLWEPWNGRYRVSPLGQKVEAVKTLDSTRGHRERLASWRRQLAVSHAPDGNPLLDDDLFDTLDLPGIPPSRAGEVAGERRPRRRVGEPGEAERREPGVPLDFPSDF